MSAASLLVTAPELARLLDGPEPPAVLDVRWRLQGPPGLQDHLSAHVSGAAFVDLDRDLADPPGVAGRHPLPEPEAFTAAMRHAGVRADREVVLYDDADSTAAARGWWCLRYFGHRRVRVLDGGFRAWVEAGLAVQAGEVTPPPGDFTARPGGMPTLAAEEAARVARSGVLLDARAVARYRGEVEPVDPVAGHVPGALSAPTTDNVDPSGRFLPSAQLRRRFADLGADPDEGGDGGEGGGLGVYCGSGVTAAHEVLALDLAGLPAALYVGSWSHWVAEPTRPVATGPDPG